MQLGKILWYNGRDGYGIIEDSEGNEIYFSRDLLHGFSKESDIKSDTDCLFDLNTQHQEDLLIAASVFPFEEDF